MREQLRHSFCNGDRATRFDVLIQQSIKRCSSLHSGVHLPFIVHWFVEEMLLKLLYRIAPQLFLLPELGLCCAATYYVQLGKRGMCEREEGGNKSVVTAFNGSLIGRKPFLYCWTWHITNIPSVGTTQSNWLSSFVCQPTDYSLCVWIVYNLLAAQTRFGDFWEMLTLNLMKEVLYIFSWWRDGI